MERTDSHKLLHACHGMHTSVHTHKKKTNTDNNPVHDIINKKNYLVIDLLKEIKDVYTQNDKALRKATRDHTKEWKSS